MKVCTMINMGKKAQNRNWDVEGISMSKRVTLKINIYFLKIKDSKLLEKACIMAQRKKRCIEINGKMEKIRSSNYIGKCAFIKAEKMGLISTFR